MTQVLKGMRIVEGSAFVAVPLAGMTQAPGVGLLPRQGKACSGLA